MWFFSTLGFYSVVCARNIDGSLDDSKVMVRARLREHLENLAGRFFDDLYATPIITTNDTDYRYRIVIPKETWGNLLKEMATEITYSNFKGEVSKNKEHVQSGYERSLHDVWNVMFRLQLTVPEALNDAVKKSPTTPLASIPTPHSNSASDLAERWTLRIDRKSVV